MDWNFVIFSAVKILGVFAVLMSIVAYAVWVERKVSAAIQDRHGPNRFGPFRLAAAAADAIKAFLKEDFTPAHVRKIYYWLAPAIVMIPSILVVAVIPFGSYLGHQKMVIADLNVGILYTFGIVSLGVYGIVLAGYAANSKYPFLGGIRSSAQLISYEIAMGMSVIPVFLITGTLNLSAVVEYQGDTAGWRFRLSPRIKRLKAGCLWPFTFLAFLYFPGGGVRGDEPHAVRSAGSRTGTGRRLQRRIQLDEIRAVFHGRIRQRDGGVGIDDHAVFRRLDAAVCWSGSAGDRPSGRASRTFSSSLRRCW